MAVLTFVENCIEVMINNRYSHPPFFIWAININHQALFKLYCFVTIEDIIIAYQSLG